LEHRWSIERHDAYVPERMSCPRRHPHDGVRLARLRFSAERKAVSPQSHLHRYAR
jgi:hypothetical protein